MKLIAEGGSTRTEWSIIENGQIIENAFTDGINPYFQSRREISRCIRLGLPELFFKKKLEHVFYYGAGCTSDEKKNILSASLVAQFRAHNTVESNLLAAARGLFQHSSGIACVLGTGSNSCMYNGVEITKNVRSGGYILGDEGSEAALGRQFLADIMKDLVPSDIKEEFLDKFKVNEDQILEQIYDQPFPSRFMAIIAYFLSAHPNNSYVHNLIFENLRSYFRRCVLQYRYQDYPVRFVGAYANTMKSNLLEVAKEFGVEINSIQSSAMPGLIQFHSEETERKK